MKPFLILLAVFGISLVILKWINGVWQFPLSGRIGMSTMLLFTAIGHFAFTEGMQMMMPHFLPFKKAVVYFTGLIELMAAIGLLLPYSQKLTGWLLIVFFLLILPANIAASFRHVNYQKGNFNGPGPAYLWFRIPLQLLFIVWVYWFAVKG